MKLNLEKWRQSWRYYRFCWEEKRQGRLSLLPPLRVQANAAIEWLLAAQRATPDDGVAQMYDAIRGGWAPSYPETTGYIIPTLLDAVQRGLSTPDRVQRAAARMGRWLLSLQHEDGWFPAGTVGHRPVVPSVFNTGQILRGLVRLATSDVAEAETFAEAARRAATWMCEQQDADGAWRKGLSPYVEGPFRTYYVYAAAALAEFAKVFADERAWNVAIANARFVLTQKQENDWFAEMGFSSQRAPLLHTIAYTLQGLFDIARQAKLSETLEAVENAVRHILKSQDPETGALPGRFRSGYVPDCTWSSMTGNSQMAILCFHLADQTGDSFFDTAARRANEFNRSLQDLYHPDEGRRGGLRGNYPTSPGYGCGQYLSWTQKFFLDAIMMEMDRDSAARASAL